MITVELYGVPRLRAGVARVDVDASTVATALQALARSCPRLTASILTPDGIHPAYRLSINGDRFVTDPATPLADGDALLLLSADVGG
jgi:molybdopterin converting factor small subunit